MGVPGYYKRVSNKYPDIISPEKVKCDRLFLDFNAGIHNCSNNLKEDIRNNVIEEPSTSREFEDNLIEYTEKYLKHIVDYAQPKELLFIGIDGVAPMAKIIQQRKRRFMSSWRNSYLNINEWDSNAITPGTQFMNRLMDRLSKIKYNNLKVVFSSSEELGEGEHKIFDYIKQNTKKEDNKVDLIYGLDGDLLMLSMINELSDTYLLREPVFMEKLEKVDFLYLSCSKMKTRLIQTIKEDFEVKEEDDNIIPSYIFMCYLIGNDFIPRLSFINVKEKGIEILYQIYKNVCDKLENQSIIYREENGRYKINEMFLIGFLEELSQIEDEKFVIADKRYYQARYQIDTNGSEYDKKMSEFNSFPLSHKFRNVIRPYNTGWRVNYYHHLFNFDSLNNIKDVCKNYLQGLYWTLDYYFNHDTDYFWFYKYHYSPTIVDLYNYVVTQQQSLENLVEETKEKDFFREEYNSDIQLLMVLPTSSNMLLKPELRPVTYDVKYNSLHYYPKKFFVYTYLARWVWETHPKITLPNLEHFTKVYKNITKF